jgi:hypothetical protein
VPDPPREAGPFRFAQFEFAWPLGPDDGRYLLRPAAGAEPTHVLVLATLGATQRRLLSGRRPRSAEPEPEPEPVATARATVILAERLGSEEAGDAWLRGAGRSDAHVTEALAALNRALHAYRTAAAEARVREVTRDDALVVRVGYGAGEQVAEGRWTAAVALPPPRHRRRRVAALRPQERLAATLAGRATPMACEELALRARWDLDHGRPREAALQLRVALEAGIAELDRAGAGVAGVPERVEELRGFRETVGAAANAALAGELSSEQAEAVEAALGRLEAAIRALAAAGPRE